jgi:NAD(P)-dependent dehydrogenase (short-subunit alcohol dehydrogenase family)
MKTLKELNNLKGRRAVITGAAGRIGKVMADTLAELGADIVLVDLDSTNLQSIRVDLENRWDIKVEAFFCDLENQKERNDFLNFLTKDSKLLNILINNAAFVGASDLNGWVEPFEKQTIETWRRAFEVNITSIFDLSKGLTQKIRESGNGSVINTSSIYGILGPDYSLYEGTEMGNPAAYASSKGALIQLTKWLSTTLAPSIRVNSISPGGIYAGQPEIFVKRYEKRTPLARMATELDLKGVTSFLASDLSSYVTGQNIMIDGGWSSW